MLVMYILMMLTGVIIGVFLDRLIPSKEERIEKEYVKALKDVIEEDLQKNVKKKNSNKIWRINENRRWIKIQITYGCHKKNF